MSYVFCTQVSTSRWPLYAHAIGTAHAPNVTTTRTYCTNSFALGTQVQRLVRSCLQCGIAFSLTLASLKLALIARRFRNVNLQLKRDYAWARRKRAGLIRIELYAEKLSIIEGDFRCDDGVVFVIESIKIGLYNRYLLSKYYVRPRGLKKAIC